MGVSVDDFLAHQGIEPTSEDFGADFIAHYGKKGMKWGVTKGDKAGVQVTGKEYRKVVRESRKEIVSEERAALKARPVKEKGKAFALDVLTSGAYTTNKMARADGYSRGKTAAVTMMGVHGNSYIMGQRVKKRVQEKIEN